MPTVNLMNAVRALVDVLEAGTVNSAQRKQLHRVKVALGEASGSGCLHERSAYEEGDVLICLDCRTKLN